MRMLNGGGKAAGLVLVLLLAGAGCSAAGGSRTASTTTREPDVAALWHELVVCARANGMPNLPDPQGDGQFQFAGTNAGRELKQKDPASPVQTALRACGGPRMLNGRIADNG